MWNPNNMYLGRGLEDFERFRKILQILFLFFIISQTKKVLIISIILLSHPKIYFPKQGEKCFFFPSPPTPNQSLRVIFELFKDCTVKPYKSQICCVIIIIEISGVCSLEGAGVIKARSQGISLTSGLHAMPMSLN